MSGLESALTAHNSVSLISDRIMVAGVIDIDRQNNELESFKNDIHKAVRNRNVLPNGDFLIDESQQYPHLHDVFIFVAVKQ